MEKKAFESLEELILFELQPESRKHAQGRSAKTQMGVLSNEHAAMTRHLE